VNRRPENHQVNSGAGVYLEKSKELLAMQNRIFAEGGPSFGQLRARMSVVGYDVDEIARRSGIALSPED
jgi:CPA2 family monovalent cation:H+ antiporter-2